MSYARPSERSDIYLYNSGTPHEPRFNLYVKRAPHPLRYTDRTELLEALLFLDDELDVTVPQPALIRLRKEIKEGLR